jgi:hypothetical protein
LGLKSITKRTSSVISTDVLPQGSQTLAQEDMTPRSRSHYTATAGPNASTNGVLDDHSISSERIKNELDYARTTGYQQIQRHFARPITTWMSFPTKIPNVVHRGNHYTISVILIIVLSLVFNFAGFRGDLFDPIMISQLVWLALAPPILNPLYWMSEVIMIPLVLRPYHRSLRTLEKRWPNAPWIQSLLSTSVFTYQYDRDELGVRISWGLPVLWGIPFWFCNFILIGSGNGTASFLFTAIGLNAIKVAVLDICSGMILTHDLAIILRLQFRLPIEYILETPRISERQPSCVCTDCLRNCGLTTSRETRLSLES